MVYSKNDIILESAFFGDLTRINVATELEKYQKIRKNH